MWKKNKYCALAALLTSAASIGSVRAAVTYHKITNNADIGISSTNTYTHKIDFAQTAPATATTVNGVTFDFFNSASDGTFNFSYNGGGDQHNNGTSTSPLADSGGGLLQGFLHQNGSNAGNGRTQTMTVSGLTAGVQYDLRIYAGRWGAGLDRSSIFTFDPDGAGPISDSTVSINQDSPTAIGFNAGDAFYISYTYTAVASQNLVITSQINNTAGASWHLYALTNQVIPEPGTFAMLAVGCAFLARHRRR